MTTDDRRFAAIDLVDRFWMRIWQPPHELDALRHMVLPDIALACGGRVLEGVESLAAWIRDFERTLGEVSLEAEETFASVDATRVTSRWRARGFDRGLFGARSTGAPIELTGIAVWSILWDRNTPRLAQAWIERGLWEVYERMRNDHDPRP